MRVIPSKIRTMPMPETYDPILSEEETAEYMGNVSVRSVQRMHMTRTPLPGCGTTRQRWGYKLSVINAQIAKLENIHGRAKVAV